VCEILKTRFNTRVLNRRGFSIIELVITATVVSILLIIAVPRLMESQQDLVTMAAKSIRSDIAAVQRMAIYHGLAMEIRFSQNGYTVHESGSATELTAGGRFPVTDLDSDFGIEIETEGTIGFNSLGTLAASSLARITMSAAADPALTKDIVLEQETGYATIE